jgi:hypothetical protein
MHQQGMPKRARVLNLIENRSACRGGYVPAPFAVVPRVGAMRHPEMDKHGNSHAANDDAENAHDAPIDHLLSPETKSPASAGLQGTAVELGCHSANVFRVSLIFSTSSSLGSKTYCREMTTCDEAMFYLRDCGLTRLDGDSDGIPCESICR